MNGTLDRGRYLLVVALNALMLLGHAHWMPPLYVTWLFGLIALAALLARRRVAATSAAVRMPLLFATLGLLIYSAGSPIGREGGSAMLGGLIVLKLFETHTQRDGRISAAAVLFFCMIGFLFGQGLTLTFYFCLVALSCFLTLNAINAGNGQPDNWAALATTLRHGARLTVRVAAAAIPLTIVTFVFFPRLSSPLWGAPWDATTGKTGISDRMRPGALSKLWNDDTPAFRVTFFGTPPPPQSRYWRGPVFWNFDGEEWSRPDATAGTQTSSLDYEPGSLLEYEVLMEPTEQRWWFPLDFVVKNPDGTRVSSDGQVTSWRPLIGPRRARMTSAWRYTLDVEPTRGHRWLGLRLPSQGNSKSRSLAEEWRARHGSNDQAVIDEALGLFNREFSYTLEPPPLANNIVDDFLFNTKSGYCEYFASSFVYLMRAANIPARVVTGFQGGTYNASGDYWIVRNSDAHAWSEVWLQGRGWVRVDPTAAVAPDRINRGSLSAAMPEAANWYNEGWGAEWRDRFDLLSRYWRQAVIEFDAVRQRNLLQQVGLEELSWQALGGALLIFGALSLALGAWFSLRQTGQRMRDPLLIAYRRFNSVLARAGVARSDAEGPIAFGERAAQALPQAASAISELTRRYAEQRYGESANDPDLSHRQRLAQELRAFRVKLKG